MEMTYYDLKIYDNGMMRGVLQEEIEALPFFGYWQKMGSAGHIHRRKRQRAQARLSARLGEILQIIRSRTGAT